MNLLIITHKVDRNAQILGFFHRWVEEFAKHFKIVHVICLEEGVHNLPENVSVHSLGKEFGESRLKYLKNFYTYVWKLRNEYDSVFVHMNPIYVVLGGLFWRLLGKRVALWYTHKSVTWKLRVAEKLAQIIFTASAKSFRMRSDKLIVTGHGIDTELFKPAEHNNHSEVFSIVSISRIAPVKKLDMLIATIGKLKEAHPNIQLRIVGAPIDAEGEKYLQSLEKQIADNDLQDVVTFVGAVTQQEVVEEYQKADLFVNLSDTGSLDKAVLEALLTETPVLTSNEAFKNIVPEVMWLENGSSDTVKEAVRRIMKKETIESFDLQMLRSNIRNKHSLEALIKGISSQIKNG